MKKILNILVLAILTLTLSGCKKEEKVYTLKDLNHPALNTYTPGEKPVHNNIVFSKHATKEYLPQGVYGLDLYVLPAGNPFSDFERIKIPELLKDMTLKKIEFKVASYTTGYYSHANFTHPKFTTSGIICELVDQFDNKKTTQLGEFELSYKNKTTEFKQTIENEPITPKYFHFVDVYEKYVKTNTYTNYIWDTQIDCNIKIPENSFLRFNIKPMLLNNFFTDTINIDHLLMTFVGDHNLHQKNWIRYGNIELDPEEEQLYVAIKTQFENNSYKFQNIANMFLDTIVIYDINLTILK